jgi:hypothetical protein
MTDEDLLRQLKAVRHSSRDDRSKKRSVSLSAISRETGINREMLHNITSGKRMIGPKTRAALCEYFACGQDDRLKSDVRSPATAAFSPVFTFKFPV